MAKKKKNKGKMPTKNPFWSKISQAALNETMNNSTTPLESTSQIAPPHWSGEGSKASNQQIDFTEDLTDDMLFSRGAEQKQDVNKQSPVVLTTKDSTTGNATNKQPVVQGSASKIMFVVQDSKKTVELTSQPNGPPDTSRGKQIQPRITRDVMHQPSNMEQQKVLAQLAVKNLPTGQEINVQNQLQLIQQSAKTPRKPVSEKPLGYPYVHNYPKGIPRSFYEKPSAETPEPYFKLANKPPETPQQNMPAPARQQIDTPVDTNPTWYQNPQYPAQQSSFIQTFEKADYPQTYSPSDIYADNFASTSQNDVDEELELEMESAELESGQKRQSAFDRLGPVSQPKKPKLTINLLFNKEQAIREVIDGTTEETEKEKYIPVHLRKDILTSTDETVIKYLEFWPWKKSVAHIKTVTARSSKSVMLLEKEQMDEHYGKNNLFFIVEVKGYPTTWTKENVLDTILDAINVYRLIPTFIEFSPQECKFLVLRSRSALLAIHKANFCIRKEGVELMISISMSNITLSHLEFIPKLVLRKRLSMGYDGENRLDLNNFTTKEDISHFIYFPLNQSPNQMEIVRLQSSIEWEYITELVLSHNRITSIEGFNLAQSTPKLKHLDLSHNYIENAMALIRIRDLCLRSIKLEGNPLCNNYIDPDQYVKVLKTMFSSLQKIDDIPLRLKGEMPTFKKNYCPEEAIEIVEKFLEVYFPLLESTEDGRLGMDKLYHEGASMTITYRFKLRYSNIYRSFRSLFNRSRVIDEGDTDTVSGSTEIVKLIDKWPPLIHDPNTFTIDVLHHDEFATVFKIAGILKLTSDSLAEDEHLLAFSKTFVLHSYDNWEYKITNEMVYWDIPTSEYANKAFQITRTLKQTKLSLALESPPDEDLKEGLLQIFMQLTDLSKSASEKCLELKNWNLELALDYFMKLLKLDDLETLTKELKGKINS